MAKLKVGDKVECKLKNHTIVNAYEQDYDEVVSFEIILSDSAGYSLYIPHYLYVKGSITLDKGRLDDWGVSPKFLNEKTYYIKENCVYRVVSRADGCACAKCQEFYFYAEPNQPDGTLICFLCRTYRFR
jgi:hypothetical protein